MVNKYLLDMTIKERMDEFITSTFQPHTDRRRMMTFPEVWDCYEQWCEAMNVPVMGGQLHLGVALKARFFSIKPKNRKLWFMEVKPDMLASEEEESEHQS